jgi:galactokinase
MAFSRLKAELKTFKLMFIAGRIEFLGKHTDYCGGRSLVCAIDRGFHVSISPNENNFVNLFNEDINETVSFQLDSNTTISINPWSKYPMTVVQRVLHNFQSCELRGVNICFHSDLPPAAGLSSSSALIISTFLALSEVNNLSTFEEYKRNISNSLDLAEYLGCVENGQTFRELNGRKGVGTFGGSQDQTAILCCKKNHLSRFSFVPVVSEKDVFLPEEYAFVIASSGVTAEKTGEAMAKYNRVSLMVSEIVKKWPGKEKTLAQIIEKAGLKELEKFIGQNEFSFPKQDLLNRVRQFYVESFEIIPQVSQLLENNEFEKIGELIDLSQQNAERFLQNQTPETIYLQRLARKSSALAASAFGAGFGGSVYALVNANEAEKFADEWKATYLKKFPQFAEKAEFFVTQPAESKISD